MNSWTEALTNIKQAIISRDAKAYAEAVKNALNSNLPERDCGNDGIGYEEGEIRIDYKDNIIFLNEKTITIYEVLSVALECDDEEIGGCIYLCVPNRTITLHVDKTFTDEQLNSEALDSVVKLLNQVLETCKD